LIESDEFVCVLRGEIPVATSYRPVSSNLHFSRIITANNGQ